MELILLQYSLGSKTNNSNIRRFEIEENNYSKKEDFQKQQFDDNFHFSNMLNNQHWNCKDIHRNH